MRPSTILSALVATTSFLGVSAQPKQVNGKQIPYVVWDPTHNKFGPYGPGPYSFGGEQLIYGEMWHICDWLQNIAGVGGDFLKNCKAARDKYKGTQQQGMENFNHVMGIGPYDPGNPGAVRCVDIKWGGSNEKTKVVPAVCKGAFAVPGGGAGAADPGHAVGGGAGSDTSGGGGNATETTSTSGDGTSGGGIPASSSSSPSSSASSSGGSGGDTSSGGGGGGGNNGTTATTTSTGGKGKDKNCDEKTKVALMRLAVRNKERTERRTGSTVAT